ncbi:MAG: DEAD/DEAH box helicase, partial [Patescibacteria group bacterium]
IAERARAELAQTRAVPVPFPEAVIKEFVGGLPFTLTDGQRRAAWDVLKDMAGERPMHRLLNGDVGSGKTAVAAIAARAVAASGGQAAILVPTEVLAEQHARTFSGWFAESGVTVAVLTNGTQRLRTAGVDATLPKTARAAQEAVRAAVASGVAHVVIGTQALLEDAVAFRDLRLAVVDEQHRFGVRQRQALHRKRTDGALPHLLSLTATPIPRTLSLAVFGDLEVSVIPSRPAGRAVVVTEIVGGGAARADEAVVATVQAGEQAFVVCPAIDERPESTREAVVAEHRRLQKLLPDAHVALMHGKLKPAQKREIMERFASGAPGILVSTTVIEVGIDLPRATLMVIRSADRFGLAQLHQLRGRVGRGTLPGRCLLLTESEAPAAAARLGALVASADGFALAEEDLRLRGPGDLLGTMQSGMQAAWQPALLDPQKIAVLQEECRNLLAQDPDLDAHPALAAVFSRFERTIHRE